MEQKKKSATGYREGLRGSGKSGGSAKTAKGSVKGPAKRSGTKKSTMSGRGINTKSGYGKTSAKGYGRRGGRRQNPGVVLAVLLCLILFFAYGTYRPDSWAGDLLRQLTVQQTDGEETAGRTAASDSGGTGQSEALQADGSGVLQAGGVLQTLEVHFLDVGQGDAALIKCGGQSMLIDAAENGKGTAIQYYLQKQGVEKLDYLLLTHPDSDHIGSADVIITKFDIDHVFMSNYEKANKTYQKVIQALDYKWLKWETPQVGSTFMLGSASCTILGPNGEYDDPNNASIAVLIQNGENSFLFTGDAEKKAEEDIMESCREKGLPLQAQVYQVGHHGSSTSSSEDFLDAVKPEYAVISCGKDNSYGHPHEEVLERFEQRGIQVYRTDEQGTIVAVSDGQSITWSYGEALTE